MPVRPWMSFVIVAAFASAGCGSSSPKTNESPPTSASVAGTGSLSATAWTLATYRGAKSTARASTKSPASVTFAPKGALSGSTGCNSFGGTYAVNRSDLTLKLGPMTQMACIDPVVNAQEAAITAQFPKVTAYTIDNGTLTLTGAGGVELFTYTASSLSGATWKVTGVNNGKGAVSSTALTEKLTADFGENGSFRGFGGCNQLSGPYTVSGTSGLTIGPLASTKKSCGTEVDQLEAEYGAALAAVTRYAIDGATLTMRDANGATQVVARRS